MMRIGLVGAGSMGKTHAAGWKYLKDAGRDVELTGIMGRTTTPGQADTPETCRFELANR